MNRARVSGVHYQGSTEFLNAVKINHLRNLLEQKTGLLCGNLDPKSCIKSEIGNLIKLAKQGHTLAQFHLAVLYDRGMGVAKNPSKEAYWLEKAALQGHSDAQFNLGVMYYNGEGVRKDLSKAAYWFEQAALQGHPDAQSNLAEMRSSGLLKKTAPDDSLDPCQSAMKKIKHILKCFI